MHLQEGGMTSFAKVFLGVVLLGALFAAGVYIADQTGLVEVARQGVL